MAKLFANSGDPDQMPHSVASDLGLHFLPIILLQKMKFQMNLRKELSRQDMLGIYNI